MGMAAPTSWTAAMVRALPDDGNRYEVVEGELLVTPAPGEVHQRAVSKLHFELEGYVTSQGIGEAFTSPADIELDAHGLVQPDLFVNGLVDGRPVRGWNAGAPRLLFVEVLSPGTARQDRIAKRIRFQRAGIPEYWIVDADARLIERWRPADERPELATERLVWQPDITREALVLDLPLLFARIHGETL